MGNFFNENGPHNTIFVTLGQFGKEETIVRSVQSEHDIYLRLGQQGMFFSDLHSLITTFLILGQSGNEVILSQ